MEIEDLQKKLWDFLESIEDKPEFNHLIGKALELVGNLQKYKKKIQDAYDLSTEEEETLWTDRNLTEEENYIPQAVKNGEPNINISHSSSNPLHSDNHLQDIERNVTFSEESTTLFEEDRDLPQKENKKLST